MLFGNISSGHPFKRDAEKQAALAKKKRKKKKKTRNEAGEKEGRGATRGLPRRSPILVLLSPKHA